MKERNLILVVVNVAQDSSLSLQTAAKLAAETEARIETLFVEDISLIRLAELPFSSEVGRYSGIKRALRSDDVNQLLLSRARTLKKTMDSLLENHKSGTEFRVVRGHYYQEAMQRQCDIVFLSPPSGYMNPAVRGIMSGHRRLTDGIISTIAYPSVYAYYAGGEQSTRVIGMASRLASLLKTSLVVLIQLDAVSEAARLKESLATDFGNVTVRFEQISGVLDQHIEKMSREDCAFFVLPKSEVDNNATLLEQVKATDFPLVLVT